MQFFGVLPLTGRQLMYGFIGFLVLFVVLQQLWELGAAFAAAMIAAAVMTSKRWSPGLALEALADRARAREAGRPRRRHEARRVREVVEAGRIDEAEAAVVTGLGRRAEVAQLGLRRDPGPP